MDIATAVLAGLFYAATAVFLVGLTRKILHYWRAPSPLKIPVTPAPTTRPGVALRLVREVLLFETLFRSEKWTWTFGWTFHVGLFLVAVSHLKYFTEPVWGWVVLLQPLEIYATWFMVLGLAGLWMRRLLVDRVRYLTKPSDHLMLGLLAGIAGSGLLITYVAFTDIVAVKVFFLGLMRFDLAHLQTLPGDWALWSHLLLVVALLAVFPFSKLLHAPGVFFSPSLHQVDNPREQRQLAPWAAELGDPGEK